MINMFVLDDNMDLSASYTYDIHLRAQIFELTQIIHNIRTLYKLESAINFKNSHKHHPINLWAAASLGNYMYMVDYCNVLQSELHYRGYPNVHKCIEMIRKHQDHDNIHFLKTKFPALELTKWQQYMPPIFYHDDTKIAYRMYYFFLKRYKLPNQCTWTNRDIPDWYNYDYFINNYLSDMTNIINGGTADFRKAKIPKKKKTITNINTM